MRSAMRPSPGGTVAIMQGCTCPVIDNHHGHGVPSKNGPQFWINANCPVHAPAEIVPLTQSDKDRMLQTDW